MFKIDVYKIGPWWKVHVLRCAGLRKVPAEHRPQRRQLVETYEIDLAQDLTSVHRFVLSRGWCGESSREREGRDTRM